MSGSGDWRLMDDEEEASASATDERCRHEADEDDIGVPRESCWKPSDECGTNRSAAAEDRRRGTMVKRSL